MRKHLTKFHKEQQGRFSKIEQKACKTTTEVMWENITWSKKLSKYDGLRQSGVIGVYTPLMMQWRLQIRNSTSKYQKQQKVYIVYFTVHPIGIQDCICRWYLQLASVKTAKCKNELRKINININTHETKVVIIWM